jgi:hypothetical protein
MPTDKMMTFHIPEDVALQQAFGVVSMSHAHMDYCLRMMIKTLASVSIEEALDSTAFVGSRELRDRISKLAKARLGEGQPLTKLRALLERCRRLTESRNELLHNIVARELDGPPFVRRADHTWGPVPTAAEVQQLAKSIESVVVELNMERLVGFIDEALGARK